MMKVVNSRPADSNQELSKLLRQAGFEPVDIPFVEILADEESLAKAGTMSPTSFTGVFLSSPNGLRHFQEGLLPSQFERWAAKPFYLVGKAARPLVEAAGGKVAFVPEESSLEGFLKEYRAKTEPGRLPLAQRWLHPCSRSTRLDPAEFRKRGVEVVNAPVYRPAAPTHLAASLAGDGKDAAAILFCSGSAVENCLRAVPALAARLGTPHGPLAVSIGPSTSRVLQDHGVGAFQQALHADDASLVDALKAASGGAKTLILKADTTKRNPESMA